jgi:cytidylate kinase
MAKCPDGGELPDLDELEDEIRKRDREDAERELAPLKKHAEAHEIDTSDLTIERQVAIVYKLALDLQKDDR